MGMLDLWQKDAEIASRPWPGEGIDLPSFLEFHFQQIMHCAEAAAALGIIICIVLFRSKIRTGAVIFLASMTRAAFPMKVIARDFWKDVQSRINSLDR